MAYDAAASQMLLFGGYLLTGNPLTTYYNDTWLWNGADWIQLSPPTSPSPRNGQTMVYDAGHQQVVLFGGAGGTYLNDTWLWDGTTWTQAAPATNPPARAGAAMAYDIIHGNVVLFGGGNGAVPFLSDTWIWDGTNWTEAAPANSPGPRTGSSIVFDAARGQVMLFGGQGAYGAYGNDTWTWDGTNWTQQSPATAPPARSDQAMAYDPALGATVMFSGYNSAGTNYTDTWAWDGTNWTELTPATSPGLFVYASMDYNPANGQLLLFGGVGTANPTWLFGAPVTVPDVVGEAQATATSAITGVGLVVGTVTPQSSGTVPSGEVISENPAAASYVNYGSSVNLVVSSGPPQYSLTIRSSPLAGGTVSPTSGGSYNQGANVPISAVSAAGYAFVGWTGSADIADPTSASTSITMNSAEYITADFQAYAAGAQTTTQVGSTLNPSFTTAPGNLVTFIASVTSTSAVSAGTVTFTNNGTPIPGCSGIPVSNGVAQCPTTFTSEGSQGIEADYSGYASLSSSYASSFGYLGQQVNNHTTQAGNQWCNTGPVTIPNASGGATPYPSRIFVTGYGGNIGKVTLTLNGINSSNMPPTDLLLVGPTGAAIVPFANVGDASTINGVNITLDDAAASLLPYGSPLTTGIFQPTSMSGGTSLLFPAPAPLLNAGDYAAGDGTATLASTFSGTPPNGTWELFAKAGAANGAGVISGGWCVNIITFVTIPNVVGESQAQAASDINTAGLVVGTTTQQSSSSVPSGDVISQTPAGATQAAAGSAVNIVVSTGPQQVAVPNVVGDTQTAAASAITAAGLTVGNVTTANSSSVPSGEVISENPAAGATQASTSTPRSTSLSRPGRSK